MRRSLVVFSLLLISACGGDTKKDTKPAAVTDDTGGDQPAKLGIPQNVAAVGVARGVSIGWSAVAGAESYVVAKATKSGGPYTDLGKPTDTRYDETELTPGDTFYYVVRAVKGQDVSDNSAESAATVQYPAAPAPATVAAVSLDGQVRLYWAAAAGAKGYQIRRALAGVTVPAGTATALTYLDTGLTNGSVYQYSVGALNEDGLATPSTWVTVMPFAKRLLCVSSAKSNDVFAFPNDVSAAPAPVRSIHGVSPVTSPTLIAPDTARDTLLVFDAASNEVLTFARSAATATPVRKLRGTWASPVGITVDTSAGVLWVADQGGTLYAYPVTDAGTGTVLRSIAVQSGVIAVAVDPGHGEVFTADATSVKAWTTATLALVRTYGPYSGGRGLAYAAAVDRIGVLGANNFYTVDRVSKSAGTSSWGAANWRAISYSEPRRAFLITRSTPTVVTVYAYPATGGASNGSINLSAGSVTSTTIAGDPLGSYWMGGNGTVRRFNTDLASASPTGGLGSVNGLSVPGRLASDSVREELYVYNAGSGMLAAYPWSADGAVAPARTVQTTNGPALSGEVLVVPGHDAVYAGAGTNGVLRFTRTSSGLVDFGAAMRVAEVPPAFHTFLYDGGLDRIIGHVATPAPGASFGFWGTGLGTATAFANDLLSLSTLRQTMALDGDRLFLTYDGNSVIYNYSVSGSNVSYLSYYVLWNAGPGRSTLLIDERNNELVYGIGGKVYSIPKRNKYGLVAPRRILDVSAYVGSDVSGMAFCSP